MANNNRGLDYRCGHTRFLVSMVLPVLILLVLTSTIQPTLAHSPSGMELAYDVDAQTLSVTITHSVADLDTHYVKRVEIKRNGELDRSEDYTIPLNLQRLPLRIPTMSPLAMVTFSKPLRFAVCLGV